MSVRNILAALAAAFTVYLSARALVITEPVPQPTLIYAAFVFYQFTTLLCIFWRPRRRPDARPPDAPGQRSDKLPMWVALLALGNAALVPLALAIGVGEEWRTATFATWYLGGIGALMVVVVVRRRPWIGWIGLAILAVESMIFMGPGPALALGLVGSVVWVIVANLVRYSLDRAARDTAQLAQLQRAASAWQASQLVRQRERRVQVQQALAVAGPVLARVVATGGLLDVDDRLEARLAEGRLRDELRGPRLLDDDVRAELERARRRGASVTVLDEGGLDGLDEDSLAVIRHQLAETLRNAASDRLYIRTSPHESIAVTVVGRSGSDQGLSDEDAVDLWSEIQHP
ncbi:hypothetical protein [Microbacterium sp. SLBN-146]|uniref:hypothetical protein n=1 Tax=Microbacterium sp. SLBN-146 TaxID=2768457 RepID=UPI001173CA1D|nr:hypothetical protein [Microbacterium sp. SLBN-146]TQJ32747.1 hypothetical protein FBY39_3261 [Microbacterium sp. SLBN-146]